MIKGNVCVSECVKERKGACAGSFREGGKRAEQRRHSLTDPIGLCVPGILFPCFIYRVPTVVQHVKL